MPRHRGTLGSYQRGIAGVLFVLLAGLGLSAAALGTLYAVRATQEREVSLHAATHAQAGAWAGVEVLRLYLQSIDSDTLAALTANQKLSIQLGELNLDATLVSNELRSDETYRVTANIRNRDEAARAASVIQAVYSVTPGGSAQTDSSLPWPGVLNIYNDLNMSGGIEITGGESANFNVDGSVTMSSASVTGINSIKATGDISIGSGISVVTLYSNGNITLSGSANVTTASALGNISVSSGGSQGTLNANGNIVITNGSTSTANARGYITASSGGTHGTFTAGEYITLSNGTLGNANAVGNVTISSWPTLTNTRSEATVTCPSQWWTNYASILAGVSTSNCPTSNVTAPASVSVTPIDELEEFTLERPHVDAWQLQDSANYGFRYEDGHIVVDVANVSTIETGSYRIGKIKVSYNDKWGYLCSDLDSSGYCATECATITSGSCAGTGLANLHKICQGTWDGAECIAYSKGTWTLNGTSGSTVVAPGVLWFEGDLALQSGYFRNSIIATGDIATSGSDKVAAINWSGYSLTCENSTFSGLYPTNFCDLDSDSLIANSIGNIALLAGGYVDDTFSGGEISLGASTEIFGSVVAGDTLLTSGSSTVHGYVTAAGQGGGTSNDWTGKLLIDLEDMPDTYTPDDTPSTDDECEDDCDGSETTTEASASVLWTRYL